MGKSIFISIILSMFVSYSSLQSCPTCVGRSMLETTPFFSDEYYQSKDNQQAHDTAQNQTNANQNDEDQAEDES